MKQFFTNILMTIAVFGLSIGVAAVVYGVEEPAEISGVCDISNNSTNAPTFYLPDVGVGYVKKANPGINTISELRQVCTKEVYQELLRQYCKQNSKPVQQGVITYNKDGKIISSGGSAFGSDYVYCDSLGADPSKITGACGLRGNANAPGFFDPDIGVGYIKKAQPGVNSIEGLREVCTREVYEELLNDYCKQNTEPASPEVITYGEGGGYQSVGGSAFGSDPFRCFKDVPKEEVLAVSFPIPELGNCGSQEECHDYCEDLEHASACIAYAKGNNLLSEEDEKTLEEFSDVIENGGPGGCKTEESCGAYCEDTANLKECLGFVKKHNLLTDDEIKEVEEVIEAIEKGDAPGGCKDETSCQNYCEDTYNVGECADFAEDFDLVTSSELEEMRKLAAAKEAGISFPGNCKDKESCLAYCDNSNNAVECMEFGLKAGFIPEEDVEAINQILPYLKSGGRMPGGCTTKEVCDYYCESDAHVDECVEFAVKAGFIPPDEAAIIRKVGGQSPGNCKSKTACDAYCQNAEHIDECVDFAVKAGFITAEEAENAKKFNMSSGPGGCTGKAECEAFCVVNQEECFSWAKEHGMDTQPGGQEECAQQGGSWDGKMCEMGAVECVKQGGCWDGESCVFPEGQFPGIECENPPCGPPEQSDIPTEGLGGPQQEFSGPGGCKTPDECQAYCMSNPQACQGSAPPDSGQQYQNAPPPNFDNAATECGKQGGDWIGDNCSFPPPPSEEPSSFRNHLFLGAILRYLFK